ncbi:MAG: hypothetical protein IJR66_02500 [Clostridia bacterium]|nr:hypothetical protein [Clostridia bacterium]
MKNKIIKVLVLLTLVLMLGSILFACGNKWNKNKVILKDYSVTDTWTDGGFVAETTNYYYFINGVGNSTDNNKFGTPVKGALFATTKDFSKTSIIVPKLFVASDYKSGLFIDGGYVYYGTPSTDKDYEGNAASNNLTFSRTKLDGTDTTTYFTIKSLSSEYRFVKGGDGKVYVVYYDAKTTSLISYNFNDKTATTIAKTDNTIATNGEDLDSYTFIDTENLGDAVVLYTSKIYAEKYDEEKAKEDGYTRSTKNYNNVYAYKVGDGKLDNGFYGVNVLDGNKTTYEKYAIKKVNKNEVFYTATVQDGNSTVKYYVNTIENLIAKNTATELTNKTFFDIEGSSLIVSSAEVYYVDSENGLIMKSTLVGNVYTETRPVAKTETVDKLYFIDGDFMYYANSDGKLARIKLTVDGAEVSSREEIVSKDTIATDWYTPKLLNGNIFYIDNSANGGSYVNVVDVNGEVKEKDTNDDGETDVYYLGGQFFIGEEAVGDAGLFIKGEIVSIANNLDGKGRIVFDADDNGNIVLDADGNPTNSEIVKVKAKVDEFIKNKANKEALGEDNISLINKYSDALKVSVKMYKLSNFKKLSEDEKNAKKGAYEDVKTELESILKNDKTEGNTYYSEMRALIVVNLNYEYQCARAFFEE